MAQIWKRRAKPLHRTDTGSEKISAKRRWTEFAVAVVLFVAISWLLSVVFDFEEEDSSLVELGPAAQAQMVQRT